MKSEKSLKSTYESQRRIFEEAQQKRINNRNVQIQKIETKIKSLQNHLDELKQANENEHEFDSFESFRDRSQQQSAQSKKKETIS